MGPWWEAYQPQRAVLSAGLASAEAPRVAVEMVQQAVEGTLDSFLGMEGDMEVREAAMAAASLCGQAAPLLDVQATPPQTAQQAPRADPLLAPVLLSAVLVVYLLLNGQMWPALLLALITILWLLLLLRQRGSKTAQQPRISEKRLLRALDNMMLEADRFLERVRQRAELQQARLPELDADVLDAVQMLAEAQRAGDGDYALKALPGLFAALLRKEVRMADYAPEHAEDFDLFPSVAAPRTIRPALYLDNALILRGQATQQVAPPKMGREDTDAAGNP